MGMVCESLPENKARAMATGHTHELPDDSGNKGVCLHKSVNSARKESAQPSHRLPQSEVGFWKLGQYRTPIPKGPWPLLGNGTFHP